MTSSPETTARPGTLTTGGDVGYLRIATEEAFIPRELMAQWQEMLRSGSVTDPGFLSLWGHYALSDSERPRAVRERLQDLGELRLADMDATGIDRQIISLTAPGTQILEDSAAVAMATQANDQLAEACRRHPDRFTGLTAVAPQRPDTAAKEIERGSKELGFKGVIINSHTHDEYLDDQKFWPMFEAAEALDTPIYLHPNTPSRGLVQPLLDRGLDGAIYGFAVETGMHVLRLVVAGVFDRFPRLKLVVGHLGEALPFWLFRLDFMHGADRRSGRYTDRWADLERKPSEYLRENVWITTSGMPWEPAIMFCREVLGGDRVMYAMDYPYQFLADEVRAQDQLPLSPVEKKAFFQTTAEQVFSL